MFDVPQSLYRPMPPMPIITESAHAPPVDLMRLRCSSGQDRRADSEPIAAPRSLRSSPLVAGFGCHDPSQAFSLVARIGPM
jgi:hypothetical protein